MRHRRKLLFFGLVVLFLAVACGAAYQRATRLSNIVLLLPDNDIVFYANLKPAPFVNVTRLAGTYDWKGSDPLYADFVSRTNFHIDDLDEFAVSSSAASKPGVTAIFRGNFDQDSLTGYLQAISDGSESYAGKTTFTIHTEQGNQVLICAVDSRTVALAGTQPLMHTIIDNIMGKREVRQVPPLVRDYYREVPFGSVAWAILRFPPDASSPARDQTPLDALSKATTIVSVRYFGSLRLRAELINANETDAENLRTAIDGFVGSRKGSFDGQTSDPWQKVFDNVRVQRNGTHTVVNVAIPHDLLQRFSQRD
jgi:hypothetical protein